jgi:hypothetical protein
MIKIILPTIILFDNRLIIWGVFHFRGNLVIKHPKREVLSEEVTFKIRSTDPCDQDKAVQSLSVPRWDTLLSA